jgi:hypothetical protein
MLTQHGLARLGSGSVARTGAAVLLLALGGCVGMVRVKKPSALVDTAHPKIVRVTPAGGATVIMVGAHLEHDTPMGFVQQPDGIHQFQELSLGDVSKVEAELPSPVKTGLAIGAGVASFTTAWFLLYKQPEKQGTSQVCINGLYGAGIPCD